MTNSPAHDYRQCLIVYNPNAGSALDRDLWLGTIVDRLCVEENRILSVRATIPGTNVSNILTGYDPATDLVVAAGGDGTIRLVLGALSESDSKVPVAIIPFGTGNLLARNLGIYLDNPLVDPLQHALQILSQGKAKPIDIGSMNGHPFCVCVGTGPLSDAILAPSQQDKVNWGMLAYVGSMLNNLVSTPQRFRVTADGDIFEVKAAGVFVSNVGNFGITTLSDTAKLDDGMLDLCIITFSEFADYLKLGFQFVSTILGNQAPYYLRKARRVKIESLSAPTIANVDGDAYGETPMDISVMPKGAYILCPNKSS
jgi:diacylglycerol kinase (ATP)